MALAMSSCEGGGGRGSSSTCSSSKGSTSSDISSMVEYTSEYAESSLEWSRDERTDSGTLDENDEVLDTAEEEYPELGVDVRAEVE